MDRNRLFGPVWDRSVHLDWRRNSDAALELVAAVAVRLAADFVLAGYWAAGALPDSVRRTQFAWRSAIGRPAADAGTMGEDDARGAGEVPRGDAGALWRL